MASTLAEPSLTPLLGLTSTRPRGMAWPAPCRRCRRPPEAVLSVTMRAPGRRCHGRGTYHGVGRRTARHAAAFRQPPRGHPMTTTSDVQPDLTHRTGDSPPFPTLAMGCRLTPGCRRRRPRLVLRLRQAGGGAPRGRLPPSRSRGETARPGRRRGAAQYRRRSARARHGDAAQYRHGPQPARWRARAGALHRGQHVSERPAAGRNRPAAVPGPAEPGAGSAGREPGPAEERQGDLETIPGALSARV